MRPKGTADELERRRRRAVALKRRGARSVEVARQLGATRQSVNQWWRDYRQGGPTALKAQPPPHRPCRLSGRQRQDLRRRLIAGARSQGFPTDLWTLPRIAQLIARRYRVQYHPGHIWHLMRALGFSCQKPERRAVERDEQAIRRWVQRQWPRIKKRPA
jgi:transposase